MPIKLPAITVYGRLPHKTFPPYKPPIPPIKHYKPPPSHGIGKIPGTIPTNRPGTPHNPIHKTTPKNPGFDANKAAIERNRRQQEIDRRNREEMNRRNAQITQRFLQQQAAERKRQQDEANRQRLARQLRDQEGFKNSWKRKFDNIEYKTRNVKPWQWGVGAGAATFVAGVGLVEGVAAGVVTGIGRVATGAARLVAGATATEATGAGATGVVGKKIITDWGSLQQNWYRLWHLLDHAEGLGDPLKKSLFPNGTDILKIISAAEKVMPWPQTNGNLVRFVNAPNIGIVTVITDASNRLVTMFPGFSYSP